MASSKNYLNKRKDKKQIRVLGFYEMRWWRKLCVGTIESRIYLYNAKKRREYSLLSSSSTS